MIWLLQVTGSFLLFIVLINLWAVIGANVLNMILTDEEMEMTAEISCMDMILWPSILAVVLINRCPAE